MFSYVSLLGYTNNILPHASVILLNLILKKEKKNGVKKNIFPIGDFCCNFIGTVALRHVNCFVPFIEQPTKVFFLSGLLPRPSKDSSLFRPFPTLSLFSFSDFWMHCKPHRSHKNFLLGNTTEEKSTCTSYTLSSLHRLPAATSTIVWHSGTPALGIPNFSLGRNHSP